MMPSNGREKIKQMDRQTEKQGESSIPQPSLYLVGKGIMIYNSCDLVGHIFLTFFQKIWPIRCLLGAS